MLQKIMILMLFSSFSYSAVSYYDAQRIYSGLIITNHFTHYPVLKLNPSLSLNASYDGYNTIEINQGTLNQTNKSELAMVLGHELGHWYGRGVSRTAHNEEYNADREGLIFVKHAHWDTCKAVQIYKKLNKKSSASHPGSRSRYNRLGGCK